MSDSNNYPVPSWLTKEYLESVLQKYKQNNELKITKIDIQPATGKGENYASVLLRVKVIFQELKKPSSTPTQQESFIVKTSYESDPFIADIFQPYDLYNTEMRMYEQILPKLTELLQEIGDKDKLFADTIHVDYEHSVIIFEDLSVKNFAVADRLAGLDETHTKLALKKLAKMHATAAVLNERTKGCLEKFDHGLFNRYTRGFGIFFENMFEVCANYAENCPELGKYYKEKLLALKPYCVEYATRCYEPPRKRDFWTLNHGDFWINNIMMRYDCNGSTNNNNNNNAKINKSIKDLLLIDMQFSCWASPAVDLHYFFNTSLTSDLRLHHQDRLIQYYHQILSQTLRKLKYAGHIPSLHDMVIQLEAGRFYAVTSALANQPLMINDKTENADFNGLIKNDERGHAFRRVLYTNPIVQKNVQTLLPIFDRRGLLDVID